MNSLPRRFLRPLLWGALTLLAPAAGWTAHTAAVRHAAATPSVSSLRSQIVAAGNGASRASFQSAVRLASDAIGAQPRLTGLTSRKPAAAAASPPTATPLYSFQSGQEGNPSGNALVQGSDGNFYGTTRYGGEFGNGSVYQMTPDGTVKILASFTLVGGYLPYAPLVEGLNPDGSPNGTFFGTCYSGGPNVSKNIPSFGSVFKVAPDASSPTGYTLTYIYEFPGASSADAVQGAIPGGALVPGRNADGTFDGFYYGTTQFGGSGDDSDSPGTVYKITADGQETVIHRFLPPSAPSTNSNFYSRVNADGYSPTSTLVQARNADGTYQDAFLGTTASGGANGIGTVFRVSREDNFTDLHDFTGGSDGGTPNTGLIRGQDGDYYGLTTNGEFQNNGTIYHVTAFRLAPDTSSPTGYTFSTILDLSSAAGFGTSGDIDRSALTQASDGNFYGINFLGGSALTGTVYRIAPDTSSPTGFSATDAFTFPGGAKGYNPFGPIIQAADGDLYGTTQGGGVDQYGNPSDASGSGTVYRLNLGLPVPKPKPVISAMEYLVAGNGATQEIFIQGDHFVNGATVTVDGAAGSAVVVANAQSLSSATQKLSGGSHTVIVTNPDGQRATATLTTLDAPKIADGGATAVTLVNGDVYLVVSGSNFGTAGYNGDAVGTRVEIHDANSFLGFATIVVPASAPAQPGGPQQIIAKLDMSGSALASGKYTVDISNSDAQTSPTVPFVVFAADQTQYAIACDPTLLLQAYQLRLQMSGTPASSSTDTSASSSDKNSTASPTSAARQAQGRSLRPNALGDPPQITGGVGYQVNPDGTATITVNGDNFVPGGKVAVTNASAGTTGNVTVLGEVGATVGDQIIDILSQPLPAGNHDFIRINSDGLSATATFSVAASSPTQVFLGQPSFLPQVSSTEILASGDGTAATGILLPAAAAMISQDGSTLASQHDAALVSTNGSNLVSHDGGSLVSHDGGSLRERALSSLAATGSTTSVAIRGLLADVVSDTGVTGSLGLTPQFSLTGQARPAALTAHALPTTPLTFILTKHDAGTARGTGPTDLKVTLNYTDGTSAYLLDLRFTPGQPDVVVYQAPGVTLTPRLGAAAPAVTSPAPTLTSLSPTTAVAGTPGVTLTVNGTFFTPGTVINFNGQPLATTVLSGTQATALVPAGLLTTTGAMPITVTNPAPGGGTSASLPFTVTPAAHLFAAGLQMFSVPADYSALPLTQALTALSPRLAVWQPTQAQYAITPTSPADALRPGQGYWVRFSAATGLVGPGVPTRTDQPFSIALSTGWNMIGDPFPGAVALSGIQVQDGSGVSQGAFSQAVMSGFLSGTLYTYGAGDTQYQSLGQSGSLTPYLGAWIYAYHPCTLQVPAPSGTN